MVNRYQCIVFWISQTFKSTFWKLKKWELMKLVRRYQAIKYVILNKNYVTYTKRYHLGDMSFFMSPLWNQIDFSASLSINMKIINETWENVNALKNMWLFFNSRENVQIWSTWNILSSRRIRDFHKMFTFRIVFWKKLSTWFGILMDVQCRCFRAIIENRKYFNYTWWRYISFKETEVTRLQTYPKLRKMMLLRSGIMLLRSRFR